MSITLPVDEFDDAEKEDDIEDQPDLPTTMPPPAPPSISHLITKRLTVGSKTPSAKRQKPEQPNPFDAEAVAKNPTALDIDNRDDEEDCCPICKEEFSYPVVMCVENSHPMCQRCLGPWARHINLISGSHEEKIAQCPVCRSEAGYALCVVLNRKLGRAKVPCELCQAATQLDEMDSHIEKSCPRKKVECRNKKFGCAWNEERRFRQEHEASCKHEQLAGERQQHEALLALLNSQLETIRRDKDLLMHDFQAAVARARQELDSRINRLEALQRCSLGEGRPPVAMYHFPRKADKLSLSLITNGKRTIDFQIAIAVDQKGFYTLQGSFPDSAAHFPILLAGFLFNPDVRLKSGSTVAHSFDRSTDRFEFYRELDEWNGDEDVGLAKRSKNIVFGILASVVYGGD